MYLVVNKNGIYSNWYIYNLLSIHRCACTFVAPFFFRRECKHCDAVTLESVVAYITRFLDGDSS
jgi:hypothetical protein